MVKSVLVVECQSALNWQRIFEGACIASTGEEVVVEQATWNNLSLVCYGDQTSGSGLVVNIRREHGEAHLQPDFVLLRSVSHGIRGQDARNLLYGLAFSGVPCINSAQAEILALERPVVFGALRQIRARLGQQAFPLIAQSYYPSHNDIIVTPEPFPLVAKVGHAHAGYGKVKLAGPEALADFKSLLALHDDYTTLEPFIDWDWDSRVQKIGPNYRVFRRVSQNWKGNTGHSSTIEDAIVEPHHRVMADECAKLFGGLDILGLDLLHPKGLPDDQALILELNTTAIGLVHAHEEEDMRQMRDLVLARMETLWGDASKHKTEDAAMGDGSAPSPSAATAPSTAVSEIELLRSQLAKARQEAAAATERLRVLEEELAK